MSQKQIWRTEMQMIKTRAAVAWGPNQPLTIEEVDLMPPQKGEVLVRIVASGVCHTEPTPCPARIPKACSPAFWGMKAPVSWRRWARA